MVDIRCSIMVRGREIRENSDLCPSSRSSLVAPVPASSLPVTRSFLLQQRQNGLRRGISNRQDAGAGLRKNLRPGQPRGFRGKIGIADGAFGAGDILKGSLQRADIRLKRVALKTTQPPALYCHVTDGGVDNIGCRARLTTNQRAGASGDNIREEANRAIAQS